ncbi:BTAD domain-containing putative transcriptional regulator [Nocardioides bizhenqiangii]|uniref:BTAD domain-containing putative transcriptional regulator n=1 Tax=Nocardioides bizhenqiangii TaxID=3095076 RepID=A0ABZ0ZKH3_9ACTN|nr:BTAD domain-containing putative transcriptional regulator [Nocardioides sp. HM61]WQQ24585.1 BTAD domain-containing putative transcriptional regulator [Nocardioides sp. HM61]
MSETPQERTEVADAPPALRVDLLGTLRLSVDGVPVAVPGARRRAALALLALAGDRGVTAERLMTALWPDDLPENAAQALYNHISRLRSHLGRLSDRLQRRGGGYALRLDRGELDVEEARRLSRASAAPGTAPSTLASTTRAALELWRGSALEEFRSLPELEAEAVGLDELRLRLIDDLLEARLALGDRAAVVAATSAAHAAPLRERTALLLVRALAADGRTAEAMAAAQGYRHRLAEETGLDPGPALAELEQRVASGTLSGGDGGLADAGPGPTRTVGRPDGPLVGRQHDREEVLRLLQAHGVVTLTGAGGVGKTTLAIDVAADPTAAPPRASGAPGDAVVVDLAAVDLPERVFQAVATTLRLRTSSAVRPGDVAAALAGQPLLLVLDNCEHVIGACRELVVTLRRHAPDVRVLATSRGTLQLPGEYVVRLQPLPVPRDSSDVVALRRQTCVRAFLEHARRLRPGYDLPFDDAPDLVEVLRRLDGLPLGIELAARQAVVMPLREVRGRLDRALDLSTGRQDLEDGRQRTLRATIDSSYRLLADHERRLLCALAPFPGGVDVATVEALAADDPGGEVDPVDVVHRLVDTSLVVADPSSGRFRLLFTVRAFLTDELRRDGNLERAERQFVDRCLAVAREVGTLIMGPDEPLADRRLRAELDNFRAARDLAAARGRDDVRVGMTLALADAAIWRDVREPWSWALEIATDGSLSDRPERSALLGCAADAARLLGELDKAERLGEQAIAAAGTGFEPTRAYAALGSVAHFRGDFATARQHWLRGAEQSPPWAAGMIASAALAASYDGEPGEARALLDRAFREVAVSGCLSEAAFAAYVEGEMLAPTDPEAAVPHYVEAIEYGSRAGAVFVVGVARVGLASARTRTGQFAEAAADFGRLLDSWRRTGHNTQLWTTARNAAALLAATGRQRLAALVLLSADAQPAAAAVSAVIARHSGRAYVPISDLVDEAQVDALRAEAARLGPRRVLQLLEGELGVVARIE